MNENGAPPADLSTTSVRADVTFPSGRFRCAAWSYTPCPEPASRVPVVVLAHGFGGTRHMRLDAYARVFAKAGYAALVFDYRHFGDSEGEPRQLLDIPSQLEDWKAALGFARTLPHVDADRVVAWGTSLGGGHVLTLAAEGLGLAAAIAQVPHVSGPAAAKAVGFWQSIKLGMAGMTDALGPLFGRRPYRIPIVGAPGDLAAMTAAGSLEAVFALQPDSKMLDNAVAARIMLQMSMYSPMKSTHRIACPLLVQIAKRDAITPSEVAAEAARRAPRCEVRQYDWSHFEPYVEPAFRIAVADQLEFLQRHVPVASASPELRPELKPRGRS